MHEFVKLILAALKRHFGEESSLKRPSAGRPVSKNQKLLSNINSPYRPQRPFIDSEVQVRK